MAYKKYDKKLTYPDKEEMIDKIIEYYNSGWEGGTDGDLYEELEDLNRRGCKGLENEDIEWLQGEYNSAIDFLEWLDEE